MHKELGRLALKDIKDNDDKVNKIFKYINDGKIELGKKEIIKLLSTPNYFVREQIGKKLVDFHDGDLMDQIVLSMLGHKVYGVRAAIIFYYYLKYNHEPLKVINLLEMSWGDTPWEVEHILLEMWKKHPAIMKKEMPKWIKSQFEKQRSFAFHGMELIAADDPNFILNLIEKSIDDISPEVQKKISFLLFNVGINRPAETYPFLRHLLLDFNETRLKTVNVTMKKLISSAVHSKQSKNAKAKDFILLTNQTLKDWKNDPRKDISSLGKKLVEFSKNPPLIEQDSFNDSVD